MNTSTAPSLSRSLPRDLPGPARTVLKQLQKLQHGSLTLQLPDGSLQHFGPSEGSGQGPVAVMHLKNWGVCAAVLKSGDIGLAEGYMAGDWTTPHLSDLLRLFIANRDAIEDVVYGT